MTHITCERCRDFKPKSCFTQSKRKCDQCIAAINEHMKGAKEAKEKAEKHTKTPIFNNYHSTPAAKRHRENTARRERLLDAIAFDKEWGCI